MYKVNFCLILILLSFSAFARSSSLLPDKEHFHLYLLAGQSNMAGCGVLDATNRVPCERVLKLDGFGRWVPAEEPIHFDKPGVSGAGLSASFARRIADADASITVGLIPCAFGGTSVEEWQPGEYLYENAVLRAREAMKCGTLKGILWHQGESSMDSEADARAYSDRLSKVLNGFRQALHSPNVRIVVGEIGHYLSEWGEREHRPAHWQIVNAELHRLAEVLPNCACVSSAGLTHKGDLLHFSTESLRVLGCRYAEAMRCRTGRADANPCSLKFSRLASRRFVLDRELTLCEMSEKTSVAMGVQHPAIGNGLRLVGGFWPAAHYRVHVTGPNAAIVFADANGAEMLRFDAPKGEKPPYDFSVMLTCGQNPATFVTRDGNTRLIEVCNLSDGIDIRRAENLTKWKFCVAGACESARASLSAGVGQADVRFVMNGRENALYMENGRVFFTFSARSYDSYLAVGSFDPSLFDVRLEGVILFDYGDGLLRNDLASHLFYDDVAGEWRAYASNFSTGIGSSGTSKRAAGGLNVAWSTVCPLRGLRIMRAKSLGMTGMNEDPSATWDPAAKKWRLLVSNFPDNGEPMHHIRAKMFESDSWDGPFVPLTDRVAHDSTGTTIQRMNGRKYCFSGSAERKLFVYSYPMLEELGTLNLDFPPWDAECSNGRVWPCFGELPEGYPNRFILLTMDRANFPGMPNPNWTYGGLSLYAANPD